MARKTERLYASAGLDGENKLSAAASFALALDNLAIAARAEGREVLFDTLGVKIESTVIDNRVLSDASPSRETYATITVSAEAVRVSETTENKE